ncbi:MFS transporter [Nocardia sp. CDC159]|uniref:MFS transporter n=1 Tax=Nocardia pulmonis TaxID=2951408 RepID=A0A9X2IWY1_9NOCA|nr:MULTISPECIES: MFS transporter [Nocardia]MCM6772346.1 MFS transporter [Nocardia pulmonis]MCM6784996.1 MFS transporter [Nocardia sp. CDC159]
MKSNDVRVAAAEIARDPRRWWVLGVLCLSVLVIGLDSTVLNLAIPSLIRELDATPADIQWILDAYVLVFAGLLLTAGSLSDRFGRRLALITGLAIFGAASLFAVLATEPWQVIAARAAMGVGGSVLMPSTLSIMMTTFAEDERRKAMAAWSTVSMVSIVLGPTLGGFLLEHFWWGSVFLLNIPVAVLAIVAAVALMPETKGDQRPVDPVGVLLSIVALTATVYVIIEREWNLGVIALAVVAALAFTFWESRSAHPMLPLAVFRSRDFTGTCLTLLLMVFGMGAVMLMLTQYLQFVLGFGPMKAGLALLPFAVASTVCNGLGATLGKTLSNKTLIVSGLVVMAAAFVILANADGYLWVLGSMLVMGIGGGLAGPAAYAAIMSAIPLEHAGVGSAMNDTIQQVGLAISIAILGSVLAGVFTDNMPADVPAAARDSIGAAFQLGYTEPAKSAFTTAMAYGSWISAGFALAAAALGTILLRNRRPVPAPEPTAAP